MSRPTSPDITPRARAIFAYLYGFARDRGYQPSLRELMAEFGIGSPNGIYCHLRALARCGYLAPGTGEGRALRLLRRPDGSPFAGFADRGPPLSPIVESVEDVPSRRVAIVARIANDSR